MATNSRIGTSVNLPTGATYDLLVLDYADSYPEGQLLFQFNNTPRKITGIEKVAQLFIKILMTRKGSDVINPSLGTFFNEFMYGSNRQLDDAQTNAQIQTQIADAQNQCIFLLNNASSDLASQMSTVTLLGLDSTSTAITIYLQLTTLAGQTAQVAVPFPQLDLPLSQST
jgi:hypothetical protein